MQDEEKDKLDAEKDELQDDGIPRDDPEQEPPTEEEKEYADAWKEADEAEKAPKSADPAPDATDKGLPDHEGDEPKGKAPESKVDEPGKHEGDESVAKALKDTKAWATKLSMEKSALEKELKALKEGTGSEQKVADAKAAVKIASEGFDDRVKKFYDDYPEAKDVLDPLIEITKSMATELADIKKKDEAREKADKESVERKAALDVFNSTVKPKILEVHKDFESVVQDETYFKWAENQTPAMRYAAVESGDPADIIMAITAFKKFRSSDEMQALKERQEKDRQNKLKNAQALRGGSMPIKRGPGSDPNDYESGWDSAGKELEREGIR